MERRRDPVSRHIDEDYDREVDARIVELSRALDRTLSGEGLLARHFDTTLTTTDTPASTRPTWMTPSVRTDRGTFVRSDPERVATALEEFAWDCRYRYRSETLEEAIRTNREFHEHRERVLAEIDSFLRPSTWTEFVRGTVSDLDYDDVRMEFAEGLLLERAATVRAEC